MRKVFAASLLTLPLFALGCQHTGGICDCAPVPGDSTGHNPHVSYHATAPGGVAPHGAGVSTPANTVSTEKGDSSFEPIGPPKAMPKKVKQ